MKKVVVIFLLLLSGFGFYLMMSDHQTKPKRAEEPEKMVKSRKVKKKSYVMKEDVLNTLESNQPVKNADQVELEKIMKEALDYLKSVDYPSNLKRESLPMFGLTTDDALFELYSSAVTHYEFEKLEVYESNADNVYQFLLILRMSEEEKEELEKSVTTNEERVYYTGNYVPNTKQIELVKMHGEIQYTHDHGHD
ncbi:hypothetical protein [Streptococcus pluranimalium]|uniref:hypothetical protein n=1 Tax=Streptococcus pluranimalium TaxID=82348 RepID=UPI002AAD0980|nr:hypothetical protein [Streptococcus suis]